MRSRYVEKIFIVDCYNVDIFIFFFEGHAKGNRKALLVQSKLQSFLKKLGMSPHRRNGVFILKRFVVFIVIAIGLIWAKLETNVENLWIEGEECCCFLLTACLFGML